MKRPKRKGVEMSRDEYLQAKLDQLDELCEAARGFVRSYENKNGDVREVPQPDYKAEIQAVALQVQIVTKVEDGDDADAVKLSDADLERRVSEIQKRVAERRKEQN